LGDADIRVIHIIAAQGGTATTDSGGRYRLPKVGVGDLEVTVRADGHASASRKAHLDTNSDLALDFDLPPNPTISGHVFDEDKKPASALVWLIASAYRSGLLLRRRIGPEITDGNGHFSFDSDLEAGRSYYVLAERPPTTNRAAPNSKPSEEREDVEESTYYGDVNSFRDATPITLRPGQR
jgi:hypothetical protein